jgi:hypothetical protein
MVAEAFVPTRRLDLVCGPVSRRCDAIADLQPASIGMGSLAAPDYVRNVRNRLVGRLGRVDREFSYVVEEVSRGLSEWAEDWQVRSWRNCRACSARTGSRLGRWVWRSRCLRSTRG